MLGLFNHLCTHASDKKTVKRITIIFSITLVVLVSFFFEIFKLADLPQTPARWIFYLFFMFALWLTSIIATIAIIGIIWKIEERKHFKILLKNILSKNKEKQEEAFTLAVSDENVPLKILHAILNQTESNTYWNDKALDKILKRKSEETSLEA